VDDKSLQSAAGLRYAAARFLLLLLIDSRQDADERDEITSMGGNGAVKLVNEHGRRIDLPLSRADPRGRREEDEDVGALPLAECIAVVVVGESVDEPMWAAQRAVAGGDDLGEVVDEPSID